MTVLMFQLFLTTSPVRSGNNISISSPCGEKK
jgi:hypothetical protein